MTEAIQEQQECVNCGADVRPGTQFCYNCGKSVTEVSPDEKIGTQTEESDKSLADLEKALAASRVETGDARSKIETAAEQRRKARNTSRKPLEIVWERPAAVFNPIYFVAVILIFVLVLVTVFLTVFSK